MTVVATFPKLAHDWLVHELDPQLYRRAGIIKSGSGKVGTGMVLGASDRPVRVYASTGQRVLAAVPLVVGLVGLLVLGLWIPDGLHTAILGSIGAVS